MHCAARDIPGGTGHAYSISPHVFVRLPRAARTDGRAIYVRNDHVRA